MPRPRRLAPFLASLLLAACQGEEPAPGLSGAQPAPHTAMLLADHTAPVLARAQRFAIAPAGVGPMPRRAMPVLSARAAASEVRWGEEAVEVSRGARRVARIGWAAGEPAQLADARSGVALALVLDDIAPVTGRREGDTLVFEAAWRGGGDLLRRPTEGGFEDFLLLEVAPSRTALAYRVQLADAGVPLRLVGRTFEVLDRAGAPRLHMSSPRIVDARGRHHAPRVSLEGCAADRDGRAPWRRPVTPAGATECTLHIDWAGLPIAYPALLDPAWEGTDSMADWRFWHSATSLLDGRAIVAGGQSIDSTELYDPETGTFASAGVLPQGDRFHHSATRLDDGRVLLAGGATVPSVDLVSSDGSALYDPVAGTWTLAGPMSVPRNGHGAVRLPDGRVLAVGGEQVDGVALTSCDVFDPGTGTWSLVSDSPYGTRTPGLALLGNGTVLMAGGALSTRFEAVGDSAVYDAEADAWASTPPLNLPRQYHTVDALPNGDALAVAGFRDFAPTDLVERFSVANGEWSPVAPVLHARHWHTTTPLPAGRFLVAGGSSTLISSDAMRSTEIYDPATDTWSDAGDMVESRAIHRAAALGDGSVLITGGVAENNLLSTAERFSLAAPGTPCSSGDTCASGHCVDSVCCAAACDAPCTACSAALKGAGDDGACGPAAAGTDPHDDCLDSGVGCTDTGLCDGQAACAQYPDAACSPGACTSGDECASGFCADGVCCDQACDGACRTCSRASGALVDGVCQGAAPGSSEASVCAPYGCNADGTCRDTCASVDDCAAPTVCSEAGRCENVDEGDIQAGDDGCGCVVAGDPGRGGALAVPLLLSVFALARRRRRAARLA